MTVTLGFKSGGHVPLSPGGYATVLGEMTPELRRIFKRQIKIRG